MPVQEPVNPPSITGRMEIGRRALTYLLIIRLSTPTTTLIYKFRLITYSKDQSHINAWLVTFRDWVQVHIGSNKSDYNQAPT